MAAMGIAFLLPLLPSPLSLPASACYSGRSWRPHRGLRLSGPLPTAVSSRILEAGERFALVAPRAAAVSLPVLTFEGERAGEALLDLRSARAETARAVVHRGVVAELQNRRRGTASTLTRGEVRGGGRKPYKQKKTGRARRGSQRTPLRRGGGVVFGPKPRDWSIKINRKEKQLAISTALQSAAGSFIVLEDFEDKFLVPKTRDFIAAMKRWGADPKEPCLLFATNVTENLLLSCQNVGTVKLLTPRTVNLYDILKAHKLIVTKSGLDYLHHRYGAQVQGMKLNIVLFP